MCAASIPFSSAVAPTQRARKPWSPDDRDHLIYRWVKFAGHSQDWVAEQLEISQSTVSRVVQRYERWQAHAQPGHDGQLEHAERLRVQRWLTYERNEILLARALRIAGELEGFVDVSKSTVRRGQNILDEREVSTQHATFDRTGMAARFLRLAFRINMEQLKLVEKEPLPPLPPLISDPLDDDAPRSVKPYDDSQRDDGSGEPTTPAESASEESDLEQPAIAGRVVSAGPFNAQSKAQVEPLSPAASRSPLPDVGETHLDNLHKMHAAPADENGVSPNIESSCHCIHASEKTCLPDCMPDAQIPPVPDRHDLKWTRQEPSSQASAVLPIRR